MRAYIGHKLTIITIGPYKIVGEVISDDGEMVYMDTGEKMPEVVLKRNILSFRCEDADSLERVPVKPMINLYVCKNDGMGCPGVRHFRIKDEEPDWSQCPLHNETCDCGRLANFFDIPYQLQMTLLNDLHGGRYPSKTDGRKK